MTIIKNAQEYIEQGLSIHLLKPLQKAPIANEWSTVNNNTVKSIYEDFKEYPNANIGVRLGEFSKIGDYFLYVLDLDISSNDPTDIEKAYNTLETIYKDYNKLPCVRTSSKNSRHFYFMSKVVFKSKKLAHSTKKVTVKVNNEDKVKNAWEIDLMSTGRQVVIPPSIFNGNTYQWDRNILDYINNDSKKALMIINDLNIIEDTKPVALITVVNLTLTEIKTALDRLDIDWLDTYEKWLSIGMALHHEYADTEHEQEALSLYEEWSKKGDKYEKGATLKKWKSFTKKDGGITIGTLLYTVKPTESNKIELFSKFLNSNKIDFDNLKFQIQELDLKDIELELFINDIAMSLTESYGKKFTAVQTRKALVAFKKEARKEAFEAEEKLAIGLDDTLARMIIAKHFQNGDTLLNQNNNIFQYKRGVWRRQEEEVLANIVYNAISEIILSKDAQYDTIKKVIAKKKKMDDLNGLTNHICATILKIVTTPIEDDVLNLQQKKEFPYSVINTLNKEIYIQDDKIEVSEHKFDSYLLNQINVNYDPTAECPNFKLALNNVFQDLDDKEEVIRHFLECWGLIIQSKKKIPMYLLLLGSGENGKSFIVQQISRLMGIDSSLNVSISKFTQGAHAEASLMGKLALIDDDFKKSDVLDDGFLKRTSMTTAITANPKFKNEITFMSNCTSVLLANTKPKTKDVSHGMSRRAQVFPFVHQFTEQEKDLKLDDKIALERSGILNLLINSYIELQKRGHFKEPHSCIKQKNEWIKSSNSLHAFVDEKLIVTGDYTDKVKAQKVFDFYKQYVEHENASHSLTRNNFYEDISTMKNIRSRVDSSDKNIYLEGIKFRS